MTLEWNLVNILSVPRAIGLFLREVHVLCATTAASTTPPAIAKPI